MLQVQFQDLVCEWKKATRHLSNMNERCRHPAYQEIIKFGRNVLPLVFEEMRREPDDWFPALRQLTGENPVSRNARGNLKEMTTAWLQWADEHGYSQHSLTGFSTSECAHGPPTEPMDSRV
jgi:hypothetical protein